MLDISVSLVKVLQPLRFHIHHRMQPKIYSCICRLSMGLSAPQAIIVNSERLIRFHARISQCDCTHMVQISPIVVLVLLVPSAWLVLPFQSLVPRVNIVPLEDIQSIVPLELIILVEELLRSMNACLAPLVIGASALA